MSTRNVNFDILKQSSDLDFQRITIISLHFWKALDHNPGDAIVSPCHLIVDYDETDVGQDYCDIFLALIFLQLALLIFGLDLFFLHRLELWCHQLNRRINIAEWLGLCEFSKYLKRYLKTSLILLNNFSSLSVCPANLNSYLVWLGLTAFKVRICLDSLKPATGKDLTATLLMVSRPIDRLTSLSICEYHTIRRLLSEQKPLRPGLPFASSTISEMASGFS